MHEYILSFYIALHQLCNSPYLTVVVHSFIDSHEDEDHLRNLVEQPQAQELHSILALHLPRPGIVVKYETLVVTNES